MGGKELRKKWKQQRSQFNGYKECTVWIDVTKWLFVWLNIKLCICVCVAQSIWCKCVIDQMWIPHIPYRKHILLDFFFAAFNIVIFVVVFFSFIRFIICFNIENAVNGFLRLLIAYLKHFFSAGVVFFL